jgi:GlpG protein
MSEVVVLDVSCEEDLQVFSQYLWQQGVTHRVVTVKDRQLLLVGNKALVEQIRSAYKQYQQLPEDLPEIELPKEPDASFVAKTMLRHLPTTLSLIMLSLLGFAIVYLDRDFGLVKYLTFFDFDRQGNQIVFSLPDGEYWRLISPIFLYFGLMHIAFNMALLWFIGQRIELIQGSIKMFGLVLITGLGSNIIQAVFSGVAIFGGMSGVVYGLLGYAWIWSLLRPDEPLHIPSVLLYFSLFMLMIGLFGFVDLLGVGKVANAAHLGGLIIGCAIGLGSGLISKFTQHD